ncbi:hypothetical protein RHMOL_Rhmol10G0253200 [Rhododendron molle]|uniref:Uncharacterized protein n=1 Tax=Rhododendron molle TaxID=49168 RepID=A0ACC0M757_RHOML|nr:hypothetical protein RHMOL_Rhmol10G0253200 [Rhododendron molle]
MELCTSRAITSNLSLRTLFTSNNFHLPSETPLRFNRTSIRRTNPGLVYFANSSLRSAPSEEASSGPSYLGKERGVATLEDVQPFGKKSYAEFVQEKDSEQDSSVDRQAAALEFLENIDMKVYFYSLVNVVVEDSMVCANS